MNARIRTAVRACGYFPHEQAALTYVFGQVNPAWATPAVDAGTSGSLR